MILTIILILTKSIIMIVCICNHINDKAVDVAIKAGASSPERVQGHHGCTFNCGKCRSMIGEQIAKAAETKIDSAMLMPTE